MLHDNPSGYRRLAGAVVLQACRDLVAGDDALARLDAWAFLVGREGGVYLDALEGDAFSGRDLVDAVITRPDARRVLRRFGFGR